MSEPYRVPLKYGQSEIEIKKSRFICQLFPCDSKQQANAYIAQARSDFSDANHHCWAYQIGSKNNRLQACSDDGEPHGTAGKPILNVIAHSGLSDLVVVVIRYFGGTKLGKGGLVRAYSDAVKHVINAIPIGDHVIWRKLALTLDFAQENLVRQRLAVSGFEITDVKHGQDVTITGRIDDTEVTELKSDLAAIGVSLQRLD